MKKDYGFECDWCGITLCDDPAERLWPVLNKQKVHFCSKDCEFQCTEISPEVFATDDSDAS